MGRLILARTLAVAMVTATLSFLAMAPEAAPDADDFVCMLEMTPVRGFYVDNLEGGLEATVAVAERGEGEYPVGSVVQLVPAEVMVKRTPGTSPATRDWEFIELDVQPAGSEIRARGFVDVENQFGGNCFACHIKANPGRDLICEQGHGCDPIPLTTDMVRALQKTDPRCSEQPALTETEQRSLQALQAVLEQAE